MPDDTQEEYARRGPDEEFEDFVERQFHHIHHRLAALAAGQETIMGEGAQLVIDEQKLSEVIPELIASKEAVAVQLKTVEEKLQADSVEQNEVKAAREAIEGDITKLQDAVNPPSGTPAGGQPSGGEPAGAGEPTAEGTPGATDGGGTPDGGVDGGGPTSGPAGQPGEGGVSSEPGAGGTTSGGASPTQSVYTFDPSSGAQPDGQFSASGFDTAPTDGSASHALYVFAGDTAPGDANGGSVPGYSVYTGPTQPEG